MITDTIYTENSIRTYTGKVFDLKIMDPDSICIEDIAHALSYTARFGGHLEKMLSVAQHSVYVTECVPEEYRLAALLHDASEAYMGDMPSPFKKLMPDFKEIENKLMNVIAKKFGFEYPLNVKIKIADQTMLTSEWDNFVELSRKDLEYWTPEEAKKIFLQYFKTYSKLQ